MKKHKILTWWKPYAYEVWGNPKDGYDVNNVFPRPAVALELELYRQNPGTGREFCTIYPSVAQIRQTLEFGICRIHDPYGGGTTIRPYRRRDGYPLGHMECTSHESLHFLPRDIVIDWEWEEVGDARSRLFCILFDGTRSYAGEVLSIPGRGHFFGPSGHQACVGRMEAAKEEALKMAVRHAPELQFTTKFKRYFADGE